MGPHTRLRGEERRLHLLEAARQLFGERGYRGTEVEEVSRRAGVTKPILYRHFPGGKAHLFLAVLDGYLSDLLRVLWEALASSTEPRERLRRGLGAYVRFAEQNPEGFHLLVDTSSDLDPEVGRRLRELRATIAGGLANTISDVMKGAGLPTEGAPIYAHVLVGGVEAVVRWWLEAGEPDRERVTDHIFAFVWRGFDGLPRDPGKINVIRLEEEPSDVGA